MIEIEDVEATDLVFTDEMWTTGRCDLNKAQYTPTFGRLKSCLEDWHYPMPPALQFGKKQAFLSDELSNWGMYLAKLKCGSLSCLGIGPLNTTTVLYDYRKRIRFSAKNVLYK